MWTKTKVKWEFEEKLCGSVPMSKELVRPWLEARMGDNASKVEGEVLETIEEAEEKVTLGFQRDEKGLFVRGGCVKAHIKDCANQIKDVVGIKNFRAKVANKIYVEESRVYLQRNGGILTEEDESFDQPVHVITPKGPRNSLKIIRFAKTPVLEFTLAVLQDKEITPKVLDAIFEYGSKHGFGGERGMGEGRYEATVEK